MIYLTFSIKGKRWLSEVPVTGLGYRLMVPPLIQRFSSLRLALLFLMVNVSALDDEVHLLGRYLLCNSN